MHAGSIVTAVAGWPYPGRMLRGRRDEALHDARVDLRPGRSAYMSETLLQTAFLSVKACNRRAGMWWQVRAAKSTRLEQVIAGHAGFPGHAGRDDDDISALQRLCQLVIPCIALCTPPDSLENALVPVSSHACCMRAGACLGLGLRVDVADVGCHAGRALDIV